MRGYIQIASRVGAMGASKKLRLRRQFIFFENQLVGDAETQD